MQSCQKVILETAYHTFSFRPHCVVLFQIGMVREKCYLLIKKFFRYLKKRHRLEQEWSDCLKEG